MLCEEAKVDVCPETGCKNNNFGKQYAEVIGNLTRCVNTNPAVIATFDNLSLFLTD